jgi:hypothetical protein
MASTKRLNSVAHSLAHHAVSSLSYLHPYLAEACDGMGTSYVEFDLLVPHTYPEAIVRIKPLVLSLDELRNFLRRLLNSEGFRIEDISSVLLLFSFNLERLDYYCSICTATIVTAAGKKFEKTVNYLGNEVTRAAHNLAFDADAQARWST